MEIVFIKLTFIPKTSQHIHQFHLRYNQGHLQRAIQAQETARTKHGSVPFLHKHYHNALELDNSRKLLTIAHEIHSDKLYSYIDNLDI